MQYALQILPPLYLQAIARRLQSFHQIDHMLLLGDYHKNNNNWQHVSDNRRFTATAGIQCHWRDETNLILSEVIIRKINKRRVQPEVLWVC